MCGPAGEFGEIPDSFIPPFQYIDSTQDPVTAKVPPKPEVFGEKNVIITAGTLVPKSSEASETSSKPAPPAVLHAVPVASAFSPVSDEPVHQVYQEKTERLETAKNVKVSNKYDKKIDFQTHLIIVAENGKKLFVSGAKKMKHLFQDDEKVKTDKSTAEKNLYEQGFEAEQRQDYSAAVRLYKAYIQKNKIEKSGKENINADCAAPYYRIAIIAWNKGEIEEAESCFRDALNCAAGNNRLIIAGDFSRFLSEQRKLKDAEAVLRNILIEYPNHKSVQISLAKCIASQDRPIESLRYLTALHKDDREKGYAELAKIYWELNRPDMARIAERNQEELMAARIRDNPSHPALAAKTLENRNRYVLKHVPVPVTKPDVMEKTEETESTKKDYTIPSELFMSDTLDSGIIR